jgi:LmbE family N-acetylglucosaminyl deacetylase
VSPASRNGSPELFGPATHRFLSAHYDDIALSCGGTVALLSQGGAQPEIRVAFGAEPDPGEPLSAFAAEQHLRWDLKADQVVRSRRAEEATAGSILGASSDVLSFRDAIYRGDRYASEEQLFGPIAADERDLPSRLADELRDESNDRGTTRFYVPLGVGNHVDHQLCFAAGLELADGGWDVWFYEDLPYGLQPGALERRLEQLAAAWRSGSSTARTRRLEPVARIDIASVWPIKVASILAYESQVPTIFRSITPDGSVDDIERALREYALRAGDGILGEQLWRSRDPGTTSQTT